MKFIQRNKNTTNIQNEILCKKFNISEEILNIIEDRGYKTEDDIRNYIFPQLSNMYDPFLFNDMNKAISTINEAIKNKDLIVIWGDFDCDGVCSTTILALTLKRLGANIFCYIPDRHTEGYGLNNEGIKKLKDEKDVKLLITVDCGITAKESIEFAYKNNIKVIVTDHHNPPEELPCCEAILDAKVKGERYPFKELCGAGVALKISEALLGKNEAMKNIDLAALATVTDLVPLVNENRIIVYNGLKAMNTYKRNGIDKLCKTFLKDDEELKAYHLGFRIGPMINACGRLGKASDAAILISTPDENKSQQLSEKIFNYNEERKLIEKDIFEQCVRRLGSISTHKGIVICGEGWEKGVVGIVASRLVEKYFCPVIVLTYDKENNIYTGSGRSIAGISLYNILKDLSPYIYKWGGHDMAAGLSITPANLDIFVNSFKEKTNSFDNSLFEKSIYFDEVLNIKDVNDDTLNQLEIFEPTGFGNPGPVFKSNNVSFKNTYEIGKEGDHLKTVVFDETGAVPGIAFNQKRPCQNENLDIVYTIDKNKYFNNDTQVNIRWINISSSQQNINIEKENIQYGIRTRDLSLETIDGISEVKLKQFNKANIFTINDLVRYFPKKYIDFRQAKTVKSVQDKEVCSIIARVKVLNTSKKMVYAICEDKNRDTFMVCWFNQDYVTRLISVGTFYNFCGTIKITTNGFTQMYPLYWDRDISKLSRLVPVYKKIPGMSQSYLTDTIKKALSMSANTDYLLKDYVERFNLIPESICFKFLHFPKNDVEIQQAQRRQVFDELFKFNFILKSKADNSLGSAFPVVNCDIWKQLTNLIPYELTNDQKTVLKEMYKYVSTGNRLNGLVQGDVGSGKTIVAFFMMCLGIDNHFQSCMIAPTEVLAKQHYEELTNLLAPLNINVGFLSGSQKAKEKRQIVKQIKDGEIQIVVGTHAVIQKSVEFNNLGLVVVDEQHKFGVEQREKLLDVEHKPHLITMSATPIPRTLSMALYGDNIQVYNIKQKPAGRKDIITEIMENNDDINEFMLKEIKDGRQCYIVCPLIEESGSEKMADVKSVTEEAKKISDYFKNESIVKISVISGKMKQEDIQSEINKFARSETNILISTTIVEVGVNVPNSTVMVIKSSERFGLAQLHQLRGRVGRGKYQSYCLLQTNQEDRKAQILCSTNDGFEIAKQDLLLRGTGDFIGVQQTGNNQSVMLMLSEPHLYKEISVLNDEIYSDKSVFSRYSYLLESITHE